tara:strand:+ start:6538 stop:7563 length:1026 start_codon:yes stop_codon:yes gene_type:complete
MSKKTILVTGAAGFIGYHLCEHLISSNHNVIAVDNINDYYDINLKFSRLKNLGIETKDIKIFNKKIKSKIHNTNFYFYRTNIDDYDFMREIFSANSIDVVCNLAAQAGVRYSLENPQSYINSNIKGFMNILECCRHFKIKRLVYASSSSVYGESSNIPFSEIEFVDKPVSIYAASKKSNELMAHAYSKLFNFETIGLRFFTVYGPWGRPDMALFLFTDAILNNKPINVFNNGDLYRDFTYIDDIVNGIENTILKDSRDSSLYKIYNIGNSNPVFLMDFIEAIEKEIGIKALKNFMPMQLGDVNKTYADVSKLIDDYDYSPSTGIDLGVKYFITWFKDYYQK